MAPISSIRADALFQARANEKTPSGTPGSTNSAPDAQALARLQAVGEVLALFYLTWQLEPPSPKRKDALVATWAQALKNIPPHHILRLAQEELSERENSFFPVPADLIRRWNANRVMTPEGAANVAAYTRYVPSKAPALSAPVELRIDPQELKKRLGMPEAKLRKVSPIQEPELEREGANEQPSAPLALSSPRLAKRWSETLLEVARVGNIDLERCSPTQIVELRRFAKWWEENFPLAELRKHGFAAAYAQYSETKAQAPQMEGEI